MKILLTVDGSTFGWKALDYLVRHKATFGQECELTVLHVDEGKAAKVLAKVKTLLRRARMGYTETVIKGNAGKEIAKFARRGKFDLVIMGSHGYSAFEQLMLGSVASKVIALCKVPVLLVR
jgi:nucleotide-binding universal stress UspA family protein